MSGRAGLPTPSGSPLSPTARLFSDLDMNPDGSDPKQVTSLSTEAGGVLYSPDEKNLVFTSEVYPECPDEACNQEETRRGEDLADQGTHLHLPSLPSLECVAIGSPPSLDGVCQWRGSAEGSHSRCSRCSTIFLGGGEDYAISPDGAEVCFVMNPMTRSRSDEFELFVVPVAGGEAKKISLTPERTTRPSFARRQVHRLPRAASRWCGERRWRLMVLDRATGKVTNLTEGLDRW